MSHTPPVDSKGAKILDVACGSRMFWFDKENPLVLFLDNRVMPPTKQTNGATIEVKPDKVMDFRNLDLPDSEYALVVFDPPHIKWRSTDGWMAEKYGQLDKLTWRDDIRKGFAECFRVLRPEGVLVFKWNETDILVKEVLALTPVKPLFGNRSGKAQKTHWICFMKPPPERQTNE